MEMHGKSSREHPFWCGHLFVLGWWAETRQLIISMVCLGLFGMADKSMPLALEALSIFSGQGKWNRNVVWDNLLVCTFLLPSWLVQPFPGGSWGLSDLFPSHQWPHGSICPSVSLLPPGWERDEEIGLWRLKEVILPLWSAVLRLPLECWFTCPNTPYPLGTATWFLSGRISQFASFLCTLLGA